MKLPEKTLQIGVAIGIGSPARGAAPARAQINQIPIQPRRKHSVSLKIIAVTFALTAISSRQGFSDQFQIDVKPGFNLIGNHLNVGDPLSPAYNTLDSVLTTASGVLPNSKVYKWLNGSPPSAGYQPVSEFDSDTGLWSINYTLAPGEGLWLESPSSTTLTIQGAQAVWHPVDASDPDKFYFLSDQHLPAVSSTYQDIFGPSAVPYDFENAWLWNTDSQQWEEPSVALGGDWFPALNVPLGHAVVIGGVAPPNVPEPGVLGLWLCGMIVAARRRR